MTYAAPLAPSDHHISSRLLSLAADHGPWSAPLTRPAQLGEPAEWLKTHTLTEGEALLDGAGVAHGGRFSGLCLTPSARAQVSLGALLDGDQERAQGDQQGDQQGDKEGVTQRAQRLLEELEEVTTAQMSDEVREAWRALPFPAPLTLCALSYDLGALSLGVSPPTLTKDKELSARLMALPCLWVARYEAVYVWDHQEGRGWLCGRSEGALEALEARLNAQLSSPRPHAALQGQLTEGPLQPLWSREEHGEAVRAAQALMASGDIYQVNLTTPMSARLKAGVSAQTLYLSMRARNPAPFGAMVRLSAEESALCLSPERLLQWSPEGEVRTEPIKGTRPRGGSPEGDMSAQRALLESLKDRAEHTMIVDLERNDLGRVCVPGSVRVEALRALQSYPTVHHMVSHVVGFLKPHNGLASLLQAVFPGGSITGAPKLRAAQVIASLEASPRGLYCGALGYLSPCGRGDLNLPIRTAWLSGDLLTYHAGGGVVADSTPEGEWEELWVKSAALSRALGH